MSSSKTNTPRSSSRSKRSTTNLANLRLAPLTKYADDAPDDGSANGPTDAFTKLAASHRSAPTTPRPLSRSSSRRYLGGLSRRSSLYEDDRAEPREYSGVGYGGGIRDETRNTASRLEINTGAVPKAKSEAALGVPPSQRRLAGPGVQLKRRSYNPYATPGSRSGTSTPRIRVEDDWLTRTGLAANSIIQEQKGQAFIASRNSQSALSLNTRDLRQQHSSDEDEDDDEGYEEMAASAYNSTANSRSGFAADDELSPVSTRTGPSRWGSRYGSRRTSRRGSMVQLTSGSRTPLASAQPMQEAGRNGYFDALTVEPDFVDEESSADEGAPSASRFTSLGGLIDKVIGFPLFNVDEGREDTATESEAEVSEKEGEAEKRSAAEVKRRREEKESLRSAQHANARREGSGGEVNGGWQEDAKWLLGRAREAWL